MWAWSWRPPLTLVWESLAVADAGQESGRERLVHEVPAGYASPEECDHEPSALEPEPFVLGVSSDHLGCRLDQLVPLLPEGRRDRRGIGLVVGVGHVPKTTCRPSPSSTCS